MRLNFLICCFIIIYGFLNPVNLLGNNQSDSFEFRRFSLELAYHTYYNFNEGNGYQIHQPRLIVNYFNKKYGFHFGLTQKAETNGTLGKVTSKNTAFSKEPTMPELPGIVQHRRLSYFNFNAGKHFQNKRYIANLGLSFAYFDKIYDSYLTKHWRISTLHYWTEHKAMGIGPYFDCFVKVKNRVSISVNYQYNYLFWVKNYLNHIDEYSFSTYHFNTFSLKFGILL